MTGTERLKEMVKDQEDSALKQTVEYLISRKDMELKYLNEEKTLDGMCEFIKSKARSHAKKGWNYITNEVVYAWAIMYFSLPNNLLKIKNTTIKEKNKKEKIEEKQPIKNNIIPIEKAKEKSDQLTLFGGIVS